MLVLKPMRLFLWCLFLLFLSCGGALPASPQFENNFSQIPGNSLRIIIIDVGQGDATLVLTPSGRVLLIDGGPLEKGGSQVPATLAGMELTHLDALYVSHYDADHIGGISEIVAGSDRISGTEDDLLPDIAYDMGGEGAGQVFESYAKTVKPARAILKPGDRIAYNDGVTLTCLIIGGETAGGRKKNLALEDDNGRSMGLLITYGAFRYFTAGDLTGGGTTGSETTEDLEGLVAPEIGPVDMLHVNHHGSMTSSSEFFLETLKPTVSVISAGKDNIYGHPAPEVLWRLKEVGSMIYQTQPGPDGSPASDVIVGGNIPITVDQEGYRVGEDLYTFKTSSHN